MVYYKCIICDYTTDHKGKYERHLKKKIPCKVSCKSLPNITNNSFCPKNPSQILTNPSQTLTNPSQTLTNSIEYKIAHNNENDCIYCGKTFKRKDNLKRHMTKYCKIMKVEIDGLEFKNNLLIK